MCKTITEELLKRAVRRYRVLQECEADYEAFMKNHPRPERPASVRDLAELERFAEALEVWLSSQKEVRENRTHARHAFKSVGVEIIDALPIDLWGIWIGAGDHAVGVAYQEFMAAAPIPELKVVPFETPLPMLVNAVSAQMRGKAEARGDHLYAVTTKYA